ncbi:hypothetical protein [Falsirhodobacter deserti]|uniref:hypothetical protein n=1 Tax=Falsirhodobacter deserti TaxID=1365611 RepID=UPI000FE32A99|nr:hypothetical protein [Falsirhodobacter deserti]
MGLVVMSVHELQHAEVEAGDAFLSGFMADHHARFARTFARSDNLHRPLPVPAFRMTEHPAYGTTSPSALSSSSAMSVSA